MSCVKKLNSLDYEHLYEMYIINKYVWKLTSNDTWSWAPCLIAWKKHSSLPASTSTLNSCCTPGKPSKSKSSVFMPRTFSGMEKDGRRLNMAKNSGKLAITFAAILAIFVHVALLMVRMPCAEAPRCISTYTLLNATAATTVSINKFNQPAVAASLPPWTISAWSR